MNVTELPDAEMADIAKLATPDGRIVEEGSSELVLAAPSHGVTKALVDAIPRLDAG